MAFDIDRFLRDAPLLTAPTKKVRVPELKHWFPEGEEPDWEVRGLAGDELARANDVNSRIEILRDAMEVIASAVRSNRGEALKEIMGLSDVPNDLARHFDHLMYGLVGERAGNDWFLRVQHDQIQAIQVMDFLRHIVTDDGGGLGVVLWQAVRHLDHADQVFGFGRLVLERFRNQDSNS